jgi:streptogramin lyase
MELQKLFMNNEKIILFITLFLIFSTEILVKNTLADGIKVVIEMEKDVYTVGEEIEANLKIINSENVEKDILGRAVLFAPFYIPTDAKEFFIKLKGLEEKTIEVEWEDTSLLPASKDYFIIATIVSGNKTVSINKSFEVREKEVEILSCLDLECKNQTQIFYVGEKVCLSLVNRTPIRHLKIFYDNNESELKITTCLENLKRGSYQVVAFTDEKNYSLNFSVIMPWKSEKTKQTSKFVYLIVLIFFAITLSFFSLRKKKGQISFFVKTVSILIASLIFVFIVYYFSGYQKSVEEEKTMSEFKNEVINLAQKLISSEECLSYKNEKGSIDINKLEYFSSRYKEVEPECAKEINFDYTITVVQQPKKISIFPAIKGSSGTLSWIVNSGSENSVSLVASDGREIRRHWTAPKGIIGDPSRTAVDSKGNAWVGNRGTNTLVKIAFDEKDCIDKNGDGKIETSYDKNGDGIVDKSEMLPFDEDECVVYNVRLGSSSGTKIRAVCIDKDDNVYAGHWNDKKLFYVSSDGKILKEWNLPNTPYGCVVDNDGNVWVSGLSTNIIAKLNPKDNSISTYNAGKTVYGIWRGKDSIVFTTYSGRSIVKISKDIKKIWEYSSYSLSGARGVFVDEDENVYAVGSHSNQVVKVDKDGKFVKAMPTCNTPTGISMDSEGNIWVICKDDGGVRIYDKDLNVLSEFIIRGSHYGYSDFTGFQTGAKLGISKVEPSKEIQLEKRTWSFSVGSEETFGTKSFSPEKAKKMEVTISIPINIRYNDTFAVEGIMSVHAVKGELEEFYGLIDYLCINAKNSPEKEIKFSKPFHFSYPVRKENNKICMLDSCKLIECPVPIKMNEFNSGDYQINFLYDAIKKEIDIS